MKHWRAYAMTAITLAAMAFPARAALPEETAPDAVDVSGFPVEEQNAIQEETALALKAGVPAADLKIIISRSRKRGLAGPAVRELIGTAARAAREELPLQPVLDRMEQGLAKGVPAERITAATRQLVENLAIAGPLVDRLAGEGLRPRSPQERAYAVETVARALESSIPGDVVGETGKAAVRLRLTLSQLDRAVRSMTFFVRSGLPIDSAERIIRAAMQQGFREKEFSRLERNVGGMFRTGRSIDEIVHDAEREIGRGTARDGSRSGGARERSPGREAGSRGGRRR